MENVIEINVYAEVIVDQFFTERKFLQTLTVSPTDNVQELRKRIQKLVDNISGIDIITPKKIDLLFYKVEAVRNKNPIQMMMLPEAPYTRLSSDKPYTIEEVLNNTRDEYATDDELKQFFDLVTLEKVKIIAIESKDTK